MDRFCFPNNEQATCFRLCVYADTHVCAFMCVCDAMLWCSVCVCEISSERDFIIDCIPAEINKNDFMRKGIMQWILYGVVVKIYYDNRINDDDIILAIIPLFCRMLGNHGCRDGAVIITGL